MTYAGAVGDKLWRAGEGSGTSNVHSEGAEPPTFLQHGYIFRGSAANFEVLQIAVPFEHCVLRECCVTVAVVTFCTRNSTETGQETFP